MFSLYVLHIQMERLGKERFSRMDLQQKGYVTRKEYVQMRHSTVGDQLAGAVFDAMDTDRKGKVTIGSHCSLTIQICYDCANLYHA